MSLFLHICAGLGLALAAGIRPFTPAWVAGAFAGAGVLYDFHGTHFAFLQSGAFLIAVVALFIVSVFVRGRELRDLVATGGIALGGLLFAAMLAAHHDAAWPGLVGGVLAATLAQVATRPIFSRAAERLTDGAARFAVTLYADAVALLLAAACWFAGPLSLVALALLARLAWAERRRLAAQFAGLRVLR